MLLLDIPDDFATVSGDQTSVDTNIDIGAQVPSTTIDKRGGNSA